MTLDGIYYVINKIGYKYQVQFSFETGYDMIKCYNGNGFYFETILCNTNQFYDELEEAIKRYLKEHPNTTIEE